MQIAILDGRLTRGGRPVPFVPTPHQGGRIEPTLIVVHDTADQPDPHDTVRWFQNPKSKVSAHFVVARDGAITQMVACDRAAWHAGKSSWRGRQSCNGFSIGIEIDNPGRLLRRGDEAVAWFGGGWPLDELVEMRSEAHGHGWWLPYTDAQVGAVRELIIALSRAYPTIKEVAAHWEISPGRKIDTGPHFPLAECKVLLANRAPSTLVDVRWVQQRLAELGYWPGPIDGAIGPLTRSAIRTFQEQNGLSITGLLGPGTVDALKSPDAHRMPTVTDPTPAVAAAPAQSRDATLVKRTTEGAGAALAAEIATQAATPPPPQMAASDALGAAGDALQSADGAVKAVESAKGLGSRILDLITWAQTSRGAITLACLAACLLVWVLAHRMSSRAKKA